MNHIGTQTLTTKRLTLRKITAADIDDFYTLCSNPVVSKYVTWDTHKSIETTRAIVKMWADSYNDERYIWAIVYRGKVIGNIDVVSMTDGIAHMGWMIDAPYWNRGIMTEAALAVRDYLFEKVGITAMESLHDVDNPASGKVMQKIGMTFREYRIFDKAEKPKLFGRRMAYYTLTREEWERLKSSDA